MLCYQFSTQFTKVYRMHHKQAVAKKCLAELNLKDLVLTFLFIITCFTPDNDTDKSICKLSNFQSIGI